MKIFLKENWFKVGILTLAFLWVFFSTAYPKIVGTMCFDSARNSILKGGSSSDMKDSFDLFYEVCMDSFGL